MASPIRCPCGSGEEYVDCCGRLHSGQASAATAVALMRSRFSAFAVSASAYLLETWHPSTRPLDLTLDDHIRWTRLEVVEVVDGGMFDLTGVVEFRAHYRLAGSRGVLHERSTFIRHEGRWRYLDGISPEAEPVPQ